MKKYFMYLLASQRNGTLYIGSTSDLIKRIWQHKNKLVPRFTQKYNVNLLVYFEEHSNIINAAEREKRLKKWNRQWKIDLIKHSNPLWLSLGNQCSLN